MLLFNGGGGWSDSSGAGATHPRQEQDLVILPVPRGRWLQLTWGCEDTASRLTQSPARQPQAKPLASPGPGEGRVRCFGLFLP